MKRKNLVIGLITLFVILFGISAEAYAGFITGRNYGIYLNDVVSWNNDRYARRPHWNVYFNSKSNLQGTAMNFTNVNDTSKGYLVVGEDQWDDWVTAFGGNYSSIKPDIDYSYVTTPSDGRVKFAKLTQIADLSGWAVKDWDASGQWAIYERKDGGDPPPPPPPEPARLEVSLSSPASLTPDGNTYTQDPFVVTATIRNTGGQTASNVNAKITLTSGLMTFDSLNGYVGNIGANQTKTYTWRVTASTNIKNDRTEKTTVTVASTNAASDSSYRYISVPGLVVIFIPGMAGSDLKTVENDQVWFTPWRNDYDALAMNDNGTPTQNLQAGDPVNCIWGYEEMVDFLNENFNLVTFTYDWRWSNEETVKKLEDKINNTKASRVYIVAHSMGGLVANRYITKGHANKVIKLVTLATPYLGSPKALYTLETGDLDLTGADPDSLREIGRRMKSGYELLPSRKYFTLNDQNASNDTYYFRQRRQGSGVSNYTDFNNMLSYLNTNPRLLSGFATNADTFQQTLDLNFSGVDAYFIVAHGNSTIGLLEDIWVKKASGNKWVLNQIKKISFVDGDKTVPVISANKGEVIGKYHTWYVEGDHVGMLDDSDVQDQVLAILTSSGENHLATRFDTRRSSLALTINSPVDLNVYDNSGNHLGHGNLGIEENIAGSSYYEWDHNKFSVLPLGEYNVKLNATDNGSFSFTLDYYNGDVIEKSVVFRDVPIEQGAVITARVTGSDTIGLALDIDYQNDGIIDKVVPPTVILDSIGQQDVIAPTINVKAEGKEGKNGWYNSDAVVYIEAYDDGGSGLLSVNYQLNEDNIIPYSGSFTIAKEGLTNISALAADGAGNTSDLCIKVVKIDKTPPVISADIVSEYTYGETLNLNNLIKVSDEISGVAYFKTYYDGIEITDQQLTLNQGGRHTIRVVAEDIAGNSQVIEKIFDVYVPAKINFEPKTLNLKNVNPAVATVFINLPETFNVDDIELASLKLNNSVAPIQDEKFGYVTNPVSDYNGDGRQEYMVKFNRSDLENLLQPGNSIEIVITGKVLNLPLKGSDTITVIN